MKIRVVKKSFIAKALKVDGIVLFPFIFFASNAPSVKTMNHELIHILQIRREGILRFYFNYLKEYFYFRRQGLPHHEAYLAIAYEKEAYAHEVDLTYTGLWSTSFLS